MIKEYFLNYNEAVSNDFVLTNGGGSVELLGHDIQDWEITFVDTGLHPASVSGCRAVRDAPGRGGGRSSRTTATCSPMRRCPTLIENHRSSGAVASFLCVKPGYTFHLVQTDEDDYGQSGIEHDALRPLDQRRLLRLQARDLRLHRSGRGSRRGAVPRGSARPGCCSRNKYDGFWAPMDTLKDQQRLEQMVESGNGPWKVWELDGARTRHRRRSSRPSQPDGSRGARRCWSCSRRPTRPSAASSAWAPTATTSRSAAAGPCSSSLEARPESASIGSSSASDEKREAEACAGRGCVSWRRGRVRRRRSATSGNAFFPVRRRRDQGVLRRARSLDRAGRDLHALPATTSTRTTGCSRS